MTLLDASIIIDGLRTKNVQLIEQLRLIDGAVCGVTRAEVLSGARGRQDLERLCTILDGFQQIAIPDAMWDEVGATQAQLGARGVTVPLADTTLAVVAMSLNAEIWARDAHFNSIQQILPALKLYRESP
jgi:predicted nucleic acid-binding protein